MSIDMININNAAGGLTIVPNDWMPATGTRALIARDPCQLWLQFHGKSYGLTPDDPDYSFLSFIGHKGQEFEAKWVSEMAPEAIRVCKEPYDVRLATSFLKTLELMEARVPVIYQGALWWVPERIYGTPDLIVLRSWLQKVFPDLCPPGDQSDHYVSLDCKFSTGYDTSEKADDFAIASGQVRIYSYMLGQLQGYMPKQAYLITRDRIFNPIPVEISSVLGQDLDPDLAKYRDMYLDIKFNGHSCTPWNDRWLRPNFDNKHDEPWHTARKLLATDILPGRAAELLYYISSSKAATLAMSGYTSLDSLLAEIPAHLPFGTGVVADRQRALIGCNSSQCATPVPAKIVPAARKIELFIDYEYLTNVNVDFESQWPTLNGKEMVFLIGVGWETPDGWEHIVLPAQAETREAELAMFLEFESLLRDFGVLHNPDDAAIYHWSPAEQWQTRRCLERLGSSLDARLGSLPWVDLQKVFHEGPLGIPGLFSYGLKEVAGTLGNYEPQFATKWPDDLDEGLRAMVMGWQMYQSENPLKSNEYDRLCRYLQCDCKALWQVLRWLRCSAK